MESSQCSSKRIMSICASGRGFTVYLRQKINKSHNHCDDSISPDLIFIQMFHWNLPYRSPVRSMLTMVTVATLNGNSDTYVSYLLRIEMQIWYGHCSAECHVMSGPLGASHTQSSLKCVHDLPMSIWDW